MRILNGAVFFDIAHGPVMRVLQRSVGFQITDRAVVRVLDGAIGFQITDCLVMRILKGSVRLDVGHGPVPGVLHRLRMGSRRDQQQNQNKLNDSLHAFVPAKNGPLTEWGVTLSPLYDSKRHIPHFAG